MNRSGSIVAFIDLAGLYAACESYDVNTPLAVLKDGVCLDVSRKAYCSGVRMNMTRRQALLICPNIVFAKYCEGKYTASSRRFLDILYNHSPVVEPISPNQAFVRLSGNADAEATLQATRAELSGLSFLMLAGVASSKFVSRAATVQMADQISMGQGAEGMEEVSGIDGVSLCLAVVRNEKEFLERLRVSYLWKVPQEVQLKLEALGIKTVEEISRVPKVKLVEQFGRVGGEIHDLVRGIDNDYVKQAYPPPEVVGRVSFDGSTDSTEVIKRGLEVVCFRVSGELRSRGCGAGSIRVEVALENGERLTASRVFPFRKSSPIALKTVAWACFSSMPGISAPVEEIVISVGELGKAEGAQIPLPLGPADMNTRVPARRLEYAVVSLSNRYSGDAVTRGSNLKTSRREELLSLWDPIRAKSRSIK
ncbi:MAG: hypothetical protein HPY55_05415 [Firmicutes bacterium]|nr:hypothetical protein [Bacillota bacterium]